MVKKLSLVLLLIIGVALTGCKTSPQGAAQFEHEPADKLYTKAKKSLDKGFYKEAVKRFEAVDALYPFSPYAEKALLDSIYAYYKDGDMASAGAAADRYAHLYPRSRSVDYAYYMKGVTNMKRDRPVLFQYFNIDPSKRDTSGFRDAFADFRALITLYPHSRYAADAQKRMIYIRDVLAKYEMNVGNFYFDRKAYVAAANRASYVVEHFEGSSQVEPALRLMVKSYTALGKPELASDAKRLLRANYPDRMT